MTSLLQKTFGGLSKEYFIRQFLFGLIFPAIFYFIASQNEGMSYPVPTILFMAINTLLYPYSRFSYESILEYIMGDNVFFGSAIFMMLVKFLTMTICWAFAVFIAPFGLVYLYFHHSKASAD